MDDALPGVEQRLAEIGSAVERIDKREAERAEGRAKVKRRLVAAAWIAGIAFAVFGFSKGPGRTIRFEWWIAQGFFPDSERARELRSAEAFDQVLRGIRAEDAARAPAAGRP